MDRKKVLFTCLLICLAVEIVFYATGHAKLDFVVNMAPLASIYDMKWLHGHGRNYHNDTMNMNRSFPYEFAMINSSFADCKALINGDTTVVEKERNITNTLKLRRDEQVKVLNYRTVDCQSYIKDRGYITSELTEKEANFPIAYSIIMYKDVLQVEQLLMTIYRPQNIYCIHVDLKANTGVFQAMKGVVKCFPNVFLSQRIKVVWGKFSVLEVELICMRELLQRNKKWKYFINLTGQEFPLKTNAELVDILTALNGANDVMVDHDRDWNFRYKNAGPVPHGLKPEKGAVHIVVNRAFVEFSIYDQRAQDFLNWTNRTRIPDETFFTTLELSPALQIPGTYKYEDFKNLSDSRIVRFKLWTKGKVKCHNKMVRSICILGIDYLPDLARSKALFANKFVWDYDHNLSLQCMGELLYNRTRDAYLGRSNFNASWYSTLDFVVNRLP